MIDFAPVFTTGLIVHCKTLEESRSFIEEVEEVLGSGVSGLSGLDDDYLRLFSIRKGSETAYRICIGYDGNIKIYHSRISWYREQSCYKEYTFVEYDQSPATHCDDIFDEEIDISLLFGGE